MARTTSDEATTAPAGPELVTVSHPDGRTDQVPLDAALALEAQKTGWKRDHVAEIAALKADIARLEAQVADHEAADKAETKGGRKTAADKAAEATDTTAQEG